MQSCLCKHIYDLQREHVYELVKIILGQDLIKNVSYVNLFSTVYVSCRDIEPCAISKPSYLGYYRTKYQLVRTRCSVNLSQLCSVIFI